MSFNRQEKRIALVVIGVLLVGGAVLACKRANPRVAEDLWVFGSDATGVRGESAEGDTRAEPQNEILAVHLERVEKRIDQGGGAPAERPGPARRRINLNTASEAELLLLDGIGRCICGILRPANRFTDWKDIRPR